MRIGATGPHAPVQLRSRLWLLFLFAPLVLSHAFLLPASSWQCSWRSSSQGPASGMSSTTAGNGCHIGGTAVGAPLCYREGSLASPGELGDLGGEGAMMGYREQGVLLASAATTQRTPTLHTHRPTPTGRRDRVLEEGGVCVSSPYGGPSVASPSLSHANREEGSGGSGDNVDRDLAQWRKKRAKRHSPSSPPPEAMGGSGGGGPEPSSATTRARLLAYTRRLKSLSRSNGTGQAAGQAWQILSEEMLGQGGVAPDLIALNTALHALAKGGRWRECVSVLLAVSPSLAQDTTPLPTGLAPLASLQSLGLEGDVVTWNSVLNGLARARQHSLALQLLQHMITHGPTPNEVTFGSVLDACRRANDWQAALTTLHTHMPLAQVQANTLHFSVALESCVRGGRLDQAMSLYNQARTAQPPPTLDAQLYNSLAREACGRGRVKEALTPLLADMQSVGVLPDGGWWAAAMEGAAHAPTHNAAHTAHNVCDLFYVTWRKTRRRTAPPPLPSTAEATPPPKEGEGMAVVALASLGNATVTHYLRALTRGRQPRRATQAYELLLSHGVVLDTRAHTAAITAYAHTRQAHKARVVCEEWMVLHKAKPDPTTYAALTHAYTQGGEWESALGVLQAESQWAGSSTRHREDAVGLLLSSLADEGKADEALAVLRWWHDHGPEGDGRRLRVMGARACIGGGRWNEGERLLGSAAGAEHRSGGDEEEELALQYGRLMDTAIRLGRGSWAVGVLDHVCRPSKVLYNLALKALAAQTPVDVVSVLSLLHSMLLHSSEGSLLFDALSFNTAILACCNAAFTVDQCCGDDEDSKAQAWHIGLDLLHVMSGVSPVPNPLHCPALISPLLAALHDRGLKAPPPNAATYNTLMQACVSAGEGELALSLYGSLPQPDVISHNLAIAAAGAVGRVELALSIVQPLLSTARPNAQCVTSAIKACTQAARHKTPHHFMDQAERLLGVLEAKGCADAPAYACLMTAFNRRGQGARVLSLYTRLRRHKLQPSPKVLTQVALASGSLGEAQGVLQSVQALAKHEALHALGTSGSHALPLYALAACMAAQQEALCVSVRGVLRGQGVVVDEGALQQLAHDWTTSMGNTH